MEIKITITVGDIEPIEVKVDVPTEKSEVTRVETCDASVYMAWFDEKCMGWCKDPEMNKIYLIQQQNYANEKLKYLGVLTLNEVYDMLGIPRTKYGQIAGWVYTEDCSIGDNFVSFGLFDERNVDAFNGLDNKVLLDFNCIGNVLEHL